MLNPVIFSSVERSQEVETCDGNIRYEQGFLKIIYPVLVKSCSISLDRQKSQKRLSNSQPTETHVTHHASLAPILSEYRRRFGGGGS